MPPISNKSSPKLVPESAVGDLLPLEGLRGLRNQVVPPWELNDPLTGCPTRASLMVESSLNELVNSLGGEVSHILFIDFANMGPAQIGIPSIRTDNLLKRFKELVEESIPNSTLVRYGGDEFLLLCGPELADTAAVKAGFVEIRDKTKRLVQEAFPDTDPLVMRANEYALVRKEVNRLRTLHESELSDSFEPSKARALVAEAIETISKRPQSEKPLVLLGIDYGGVSLLPGEHITPDLIERARIIGERYAKEAKRTGIEDLLIIDQESHRKEFLDWKVRSVDIDSLNQALRTADEWEELNRIIDTQEPRPPYQTEELATLRSRFIGVALGDPAISLGTSEYGSLLRYSLARSLKVEDLVDISKWEGVSVIRWDILGFGALNNKLGSSRADKEVFEHSAKIISLYFDLGKEAIGLRSDGGSITVISPQVADDFGKLVAERISEEMPNAKLSRIEGGLKTIENPFKRYVLQREARAYVLAEFEYATRQFLDESFGIVRSGRIDPEQLGGGGVIGRVVASQVLHKSSDIEGRTIEQILEISTSKD